MKYMKYILSFVYWLIFAKIFLEIHRFIGFHLDISTFAVDLLFFAYIFLVVIVLIPLLLSIFLATKTVDYVRSHWH